jgi:hypothetical protein
VDELTQEQATALVQRQGALQAEGRGLLLELDLLRRLGIAGEATVIGRVASGTSPSGQRTGSGARRRSSGRRRSV